MSTILPLLLVCVICGVIGIAIGNLRGNKNGSIGFVLGFLLGPLGLIIVALLAPKKVAASRYQHVQKEDPMEAFERAQRVAAGPPRKPSSGDMHSGE